MERTARNINLLGAFCGMRDVEELTKENLLRFCGRERADVMVLFGGSILCGGDVLARAMQHGVAGTYVIVGGAGHTTQALRERARAACPGLETEGLPEAQVFDRYLRMRYGLAADFLECESTNCGNNITHLLCLLKEKGVRAQSVILCQDASMQRRMDAGMRKFAPDVRIINYASYAARVKARGEELAFREEIHGMWDMERYISLLMGEIPRLTDDEGGYGPRGKDFIAHVEIPGEVQTAFAELKKAYADLVRAANPLYASK